MKRSKLIGMGLIAAIICASIAGHSLATRKNLLKELNSLQKTVNELEDKNSELQEKVNEAKPFFEMNELQREELEIKNKKKEEENKKEKEKMEREKKEKEFEEQRKLTEGVTCFENDSVKINCKSVASDGVKFLIENKTDENLTFQANTITVNGISYNNIIMSDAIAPKSKGVAKADVKIDIKSGEPITLGASLRAFDFNNIMNTTQIDFSNIEIS